MSIRVATKNDVSKICALVSSLSHFYLQKGVFCVYNIEGSMNVSLGKLDMVVEGKILDLKTEILCYCNANNRGT